jgi:hypothetical protein
MTDNAEALRIAESLGEDEERPTLAQTARMGHPDGGNANDRLSVVIVVNG